MRKALTKLRKTGLPFTVEEVCERAGVGKTFIYDKRRPEITKMVIDARDASQLTAIRRASEAEAGAAAESASWRSRALNAEAELKRLRVETRANEARINDLIGQLFDPEGVHLADENARLRRELERLAVQLTTTRTEISVVSRSLQASRAAVIREQERNLHLIDANPLQGNGSS